MSTLRDQLTQRYNIIAGRYREVCGLEPPPRPQDVEKLAHVIRDMVATINGRMEANAGPVAAIGDISLEITHAGDVIATIEGLDEKGKRARYTRFMVQATDFTRSGVTILKDAAEAEARRSWKVR